MTTIRHVRGHARARQEAYPAAGDQLDAIAKGFRSLIEQGVALHPDAVAWVEATESVKRRFPKTPRSPS